MRQREQGRLNGKGNQSGKNYQTNINSGDDTIANVKHIFCAEAERQRVDVIAAVAFHIRNVFEPSDDDAVDENRGGQQPNEGRDTFFAIYRKMKMQEE